MDGISPIQTLPTELLDIILGFLDASSTSSGAWLKGSPSSVAHSDHPALEDQPLKAATLVCQRWREIANQHLFRRVVWRVDKASLQSVETVPDRASAIPPLCFVRDNELVPFVDSFTLLIEDEPVARRSVAPGIILSDFAPVKHLTYETDMNWLWATILDEIDPLRFTLVASPKTLAWLFSRMVFLADEWCFNTTPHIVSLSRDRRQSPEMITQASQDVSDSGSDSTTSRSSTASSHTSMSSYFSRRLPRRTPCNLFTMRPWTSALLNEGSNTRVYKIYEHSLKRPPSVLGPLLGCEEHPNNTPLLPHSVREMSYICNLPVSSHWNLLIRFLPPLDKFYFRVSPPSPPASFSFSRHETEPMDLVIRRNDLYLSLMRAVFGKRKSNRNSSINWRYLKEIMSGDQDNRTCMRLMENSLVEQREKRGWILLKSGRFIRDETNPITLSEEEDEGSIWDDSDSDWP